MDSADLAKLMQSDVWTRNDLDYNSCNPAVVYNLSTLYTVTPCDCISAVRLPLAAGARTVDVHTVIIRLSWLMMASNVHWHQYRFYLMYGAYADDVIILCQSVTYIWSEYYSVCIRHVNWSSETPREENKKTNFLRFRPSCTNAG